MELSELGNHLDIRPDVLSGVEYADSSTEGYHSSAGELLLDEEALAQEVLAEEGCLSGAEFSPNRGELSSSREEQSG